MKITQNKLRHLIREAIGQSLLESHDDYHFGFGPEERYEVTGEESSDEDLSDQVRDLYVAWTPQTPEGVRYKVQLGELIGIHPEEEEDVSEEELEDIEPIRLSAPKSQREIDRLAYGVRTGRWRR